MELLFLCEAQYSVYVQNYATKRVKAYITQIKAYTTRMTHCQPQNGQTIYETTSRRVAQENTRVERVFPQCYHECGASNHIGRACFLVGITCVIAAKFLSVIFSKGYICVYSYIHSYLYVCVYMYTSTNICIIFNSKTKSRDYYNFDQFTHFSWNFLFLELALTQNSPLIPWPKIYEGDQFMWSFSQFMKPNQSV